MIPDVRTEIQDRIKSKKRLICGQIQKIIDFIKQ